MATKNRLGLPVFWATGECPVRWCHTQAAALGDHSLSCGMGGERIARHNQVRDALYSAAEQAGLGPVKEAMGLLANSEDRPTDILLRGWSAGRDTCLDFTATNGCQAATVDGCAVDGAHAVEEAHTRKLRTYATRCEAAGLAFTPWPSTPLGAGTPRPSR